MVGKRSFLIRLFAVLAGALGCLAAVFTATDALATHVCPRCFHGAISGTGSELELEVASGDSSFSVQAVGTTGFFNVTANTFQGQIQQFVTCTYDQDPKDNIPAQNALCSVNFTCNNFQRGICSSLLKRVSVMNCETAAAGCTGTIDVWDPNAPGTNRLIALPGGQPVQQIPIGGDLGGIVGFPSCGSDFPKSAVFDRKIMGTMESACSSITDTNVEDDPITRIAVRTDLRNDGSKKPEFLAQGAVLEGVDGDCATTTGFPVTSCGPSSGKVWVTVVDTPAGSVVNAEAGDNPQNLGALKCGVRLTDGSFGPSPTDCVRDNNGFLKCQCNKCDGGVPLVNPASPGVGQFPLSDPLGITGVGGKPWTAICSPVQTSN